MTTVTEPPIETERTYTSMQICQLTGATYRQLDFWCRSGRLTDTAHGSGSQRAFTDADLQTVYHAVALLKVGFTPDAALRIGQRLVEDETYSCAVGDIYELGLCVVAIPTRDDDAAADPHPSGDQA